MDFRTFVGILGYRWRIVACAVLACMIGALIYTSQQAKMYEASATLLMGVSGAGTVGEYKDATDATQQRLLFYTELAGSQVVAQRAIDQLSVPLSAEAVMGRTTITYTPDSLLFKLAVVDADPRLAAELAGALAEQFTVVAAQSQPPNDGGPPPPYAYASVLEEPAVPESPVSPVLMRNMALGLVAGVMLAVVLALVRDATDKVVRSREKLDLASGVPLLATLPRFREGTAGAHTLGDSETPYDEAVRGLSARLLAAGDAGPRSLFITGPTTDAGATTTALDLSLSFAEVGRTVALVESDPRLPVLAELLKVDSNAGVPDLIAGNRPLSDTVQSTSHDNLWLVASRKATAADRQVGTAALARAVSDLTAHFARVVIDGPPALATADAAIAAGAAEATVLVVRAGKTTVDEVAEAVANLRAAGGNVVGTVLTRARPSRQANAAARAYRAKIGKAG